jgi:HEAT repeat protein
MLAALLHPLVDDNATLRSRAALAVGGLFGAAATTPEILATLAGVLTDDDDGVSSAAAEAVCYFGMTM